MDFDSVVLNLKILSKTTKYGKMCRGRNNVLEIDHYNYLQSIKRFIYNDNRLNTIHDIEKLIDTSVNLMNYCIKNKDFYKVNMLSKNLELSINGIENLKTTYTNDTLIVSKLEILIEQIQNVLIKANNYKEIEVEVE
jgi:hypothetical protein